MRTSLLCYFRLRDDFGDDAEQPSGLSFLFKKKGHTKERFLAEPLLRYSRYAMTSVTTPEATVRPPSRIAKRRPGSIAIDVIS